MSPEIRDLWDRAVRAYTTAARLVEEDPDAAASRAYYAAFHAVSAYFALQGKEFTKHRGVETAVHRELVKPGLWNPGFGADYSLLVRLRTTGDYGGGLHITPTEARTAVDKALRLLQAVRLLSPSAFPPFEQPA